MRVNNTSQDFFVVNGEEKTLLARIRKGAVEIVNDGLREQMTYSGITIPPDKRAAFKNKDIVMLSDPEFEHAFLEVFVPKQLRDSSYRDEANNIDVHYELS
jgi:hypothetical protein